jgi:hypothetical protein
MELADSKPLKDRDRRHQLKLTWQGRRCEVRMIIEKRRWDKKKGEYVPYWLITMAHPETPPDTQAHHFTAACFEFALVSQLELYLPYLVYGSINFRWGNTYLNLEDAVWMGETLLEKGKQEMIRFELEQGVD